MKAPLCIPIPEGASEGASEVACMLREIVPPSPCLPVKFTHVVSFALAQMYLRGWDTLHKISSRKGRNPNYI